MTKHSQSKLNTTQDHRTVTLSPQTPTSTNQDGPHLHGGNPNQKENSSSEAAMAPPLLWSALLLLPLPHTPLQHKINSAASSSLA